MHSYTLVSAVSCWMMSHSVTEKIETDPTVSIWCPSINALPALTWMTRPVLFHRGWKTVNVALGTSQKLKLCVCLDVCVQTCGCQCDNQNAIKYTFKLVMFIPWGQLANFSSVCVFTHVLLVLLLCPNSNSNHRRPCSSSGRRSPFPCPLLFKANIWAPCHHLQPVFPSLPDI